ncbi:MAG: hypothetical protein OZSIB_0598 [Candidatus Ozemobacter sibiricus]|jgi:hypothetical protein|uniref:Flagellar hook-length control protein-like C-terminal domain-containing protein n=1 Tax=Candidatus Ozemobacter sibiricus TaxID=2268124 RepID=A0A367ZTJ5_9BACT|nr:MAG: hypothetical protein OZSIB_0598 [Candidatus Ozemobacter sibiricus]
MMVRLTLEGAGRGWPPGQVVRGEVLASDEKGSLLVVEGRPVTTNKPLEAGRTLAGRVEVGADGQAHLAMEAEEGATAAPEGGARAVLQHWGLPPTDENLALWRLLQRAGGRASPEALLALKELLARLGAGLDRASQQALNLLLARRLPEGAFPLLLQYVRGELTFARMWQDLPAAWQEALQQAWGEKPILERLVGLLQEAGADDLAAGQALADAWPANLALQEMLSQPPMGAAEGRLYFQWPVFWSGMDLPDTLEGEAFFEGGDGPGRGFSLRVQVTPPRLGRLEIGLHRLREALWIHFAAQQAEVIPALRTIFEPLEERLRALGWTSLRLTVGRLPGREFFLAPLEAAMDPAKEPPASPSRLDVRV